MRILILYESAVFVHEDIPILFQSLKSYTDTLQTLVLPTDSIPTHKSYDISISVGHSPNPLFNFHINPNSSFPNLKDTLYSIYNFHKMYLNDNTGSFDPESVIYVQQKPLLSINKNKIFIKQLNPRKKSILEDNFLICHFDDQSLKNKLITNSFYCSDEINSYVLCLNEDSVYLKVVYIKNSAVISDYILNHATKLELKKKYAEKIELQVFTNAFCNDELHHETNISYNKWLSNVSNKSDLETIYSLLCDVRKYNDHRKRYYENLEKIYKNMVKDRKRNGDRKWLYALIDSNPLGSLKNAYYSSLHKRYENNKQMKK